MIPTRQTIKETHIDVIEHLYFNIIRRGDKNVANAKAKVSIQADTYARRAIPFLIIFEEMWIVPKDFLKASFAASLIIPIVLPSFFLKI